MDTPRVVCKETDTYVKRLDAEPEAVRRALAHLGARRALDEALRAAGGPPGSVISVTPALEGSTVAIRIAGCVAAASPGAAERWPGISKQVAPTARRVLGELAAALAAGDPLPAAA